MACLSPIQQVAMISNSASVSHSSSNKNINSSKFISHAMKKSNRSSSVNIVAFVHAYDNRNIVIAIIILLICFILFISYLFSKY